MRSIRQKVLEGKCGLESEQIFGVVGGDFRNALPNTSYVVQWSENFTLWNDVAAGETDTWADPNMTLYLRKYYRVKEE